MFVALTLAAAFGGFSSAVADGGGGEPQRCNAGRGNLSETVPGNDCDPGNSGGRNQGGD